MSDKWGPAARVCIGRTRSRRPVASPQTLDRSLRREPRSSIHAILHARGVALRSRAWMLAMVIAAVPAAPLAQGGGREQLARGRAFWDQRLARSAIAALEAAIEARAKAQADPAPYFTGAQVLLDRGEADRAVVLAGHGRAASERFVGENLSAYQMAGKSQGAYNRGRATAADLIGWAAFL